LRAKVVKKYQTPTIGGIRKVIRVPDAAVAGTTISEFGTKTITLAQLAAALGVTPPNPSGTIAPAGGANAPTAIAVGPGLTGGGSLLGVVPIGLSAPIPAFIFGGDDGDDGSPGPPGINGIIGRDGVQGAAVYMAAEDGEDGLWAIPGSPGPPGAGGSITVTDGTNTVAGATSVGFVGATVSGTAPNAVVTITGGGGGTALPGTIPDLQLWWESDDILGAVGSPVYRLRERTPWITGIAASQASSVVVIDGTPLNGLPVLAFPGTSSFGFFTLETGLQFPNGATYFVVAKGVVGGGTHALIAGATGSLALYLQGAGSGALQLVNDGIALIGACATPWTPGAFFQANATYDPITGDFSFRQGSTAVNSGTGASTVGTANPTNTLGNDTFGSFLKGSAALIIIFARILTLPEIVAMEAYILAKWGV
jgi:hypothetical protein